MRASTEACSISLSQKCDGCNIQQNYGRACNTEKISAIRIKGVWNNTQSKTTFIRHFG